jgi:hypothetical protein
MQLTGDIDRMVRLQKMLEQYVSVRFVLTIELLMHIYVYH